MIEDLCPQGVEVFNKKNDMTNFNLKYSLTIFHLQVTYTHSPTLTKLLVTSKPSCFSLVIHAVVTLSLVLYWTLTRTWLYQTNQMRLASGAQIQTNG